MRAQIETELGLAAVNFYGLSEIVGPGVSAECREARDGLHVHEDHFLVEVVDPDTGAPLADGEEGELVFTTLTKEALPLLRYRTRDIASLNRETCACGRTLARMSPGGGRPPALPSRGRAPARPRRDHRPLRAGRRRRRPRGAGGRRAPGAAGRD